MASDPERLEDDLDGGWRPGNQPGYVRTLDENLKPKWAPPSAGGVTVATVPVSSAQLLDLIANPVTIVASPGQHAALLPVTCFVYYQFNTTPYTSPDGNTLWLTLGFLFQADLYSLVVAGQDAGIMVAGGQPPDPADPPSASFATGFVDTPILLQNFGAGDLTLGDGTLSVTVTYATVGTP
jgi:hypothetical protein